MEESTSSTVVPVWKKRFPGNTKKSFLGGGGVPRKELQEK
jgi:hypothetical protein